MFDLLVWAFWFIFGIYIFWYFTQAKTVQSITLDQLALTWKLHKQQTGCEASRLNSILTRNKEAVGYKCDCGYEFIQKRLITQKPRPYVHQRQLQETRGFIRDLDLHYSHIEEVN